MADKTHEEPFAVIEPKDAPAIRLRSPQDALDWIAKEEEFWFKYKNSPSEVGVASHEQRDKFRSNLRQTKRAAAAVLGTPVVESAKEEFLKLAHQYANSGLISTTPRANYIKSLEGTENGHIAAQAALAAYLGDPPPASPTTQPAKFRYAALRGRIAMVLFDAGVTEGALDQVEAVVSKITSDYNDLAKQQSEEHTSALAKVAGAVENAEQQLATIAGEFAAKFEELTEDFFSRRDEALESIKQTEDYYSAKMELEAPVTYWTSKATDHELNSSWWLKRVFWYAVLGGLFLLAAYGLAFYWAYALLANITEKSYPLVLLLSAGLAVLTTIMFWAARFMSRLFLSERHMAIDARARSVMAKSFLAMTKSGDLNKEDRPLVLQPLFRAATDGIIQDEGNLDHGLAMLARALERK